MNTRALKVRDFCSGMILATERDCSLYETIRWLDEYGTQQAVVVNGGRGASAVLGIVYRETLASVMMSQPDYDDLSLEDVMDAEPVVVNEDDDVLVAAGNLGRAGREVGIVVNSDHELVGLLRLADVGHLDSRRRLASAA